LSPFDPPIRVCAVSFLNTSPLVWGLLHGPQQGAFDLSFRLPAVCADEVAAGRADIGIIPAVELNSHDYGQVAGLGIASRGPVRSILLVTRKPLAEIRTLAADTSSRTSVQLARIILERRYGARPSVVAHAPDLDRMLASADAALIIGDPALRIDPAALAYPSYDLGTEWTEMTGLPMVFAVWAGPKEMIRPDVEAIFQASHAHGRGHIEDIIRMDAVPRGFSPEIARAYLTRHIICELGAAEYDGLALYLSYAKSAAEARAV
jgi:chorismate dehydratase